MTYIVGLDIGTSKVCALVAFLEENGNINVLGLAKVPAYGLVHGGIINLERTSEIVRSVISMVENQSGEKVRKVVIGVAGEDISGISSISVITTRAPDHIIKEEDVARLMEDAKNIRYPSNKIILHTLPQEFKVDGVEGIKNPVGMTGIRVEATVHIVMAPVSLIENFKRAVGGAGLEVEGFVFQPLASAYSVLEPEEMEIGVALIDIGAGTTDVAIFEDGIIRYSGSLKMAGEEITRDIRKAFGIQRELAEKLKVTEGYAYMDAITEDKSIQIRRIGERGSIEITRKTLCQVIQARVEEIFETLYVNHLKKQGFMRRNVSAGIVLTGGTALLKGIVELASEKFDLPARIGIPTGFTGGFVNEVQNPIYSTVAGLVLYRAESIKKGDVVKSGDVKSLIKKLTEFLRKTFS